MAYALLANLNLHIRDGHYNCLNLLTVYINKQRFTSRLGLDVLVPDKTQ